MLVEFTVENFRSFKEKQVFSLTKGKGDELQETNCLDLEVPGGLTLLRSSAIYGPNAAGKSNLILALRTMRRIILDSARQTQVGDKLPVQPFMFSEENMSAPTEFEATFISDGIRYQYGFSLSKSRIYEEWLFAYPKGRAQKWFSRAYDENKNLYVWDMGSSFHGQKQMWQDSTRSNALFLSTAVQLNSEQLSPVYNWFRTTLRTVDTGGWNPTFTASLFDEKENRSQILSFLKAADFDIEDVEVKEDKFDPDSLPSDMPQNIRDLFAQELKDKTVFEIRTVHRTEAGGLVHLEFSEESDGTQKFFSIAGPWIDTLKNGYVLVIDELHDNLHPNMVKFLVDLFHDPQKNKNNAQLVFTTHETSILSQDVFRRDQIWFCEKDKMQASHLYALSDFSVRKGRENLERSYLSGRYGALPIVREFELVQ